MAKTEQSQAPAAQEAGPGLKWGPTLYRVRASDKEAQGAHFASAPFNDKGKAEDFAAWLKAQGGRFSLIRLEASKEAMLA